MVINLTIICYTPSLYNPCKGKQSSPQWKRRLNIRLPWNWQCVQCFVEVYHETGNVSSALWKFTQNLLLEGVYNLVENRHWMITKDGKWQ